MASKVKSQDKAVERAASRIATVEKKDKCVKMMVTLYLEKVPYRALQKLHGERKVSRIITALIREYLREYAGK